MGSPKVAVVGVPGGWSSERLADALADRSGFRALVDLSKVTFDLSGGTAWYRDLDLSELDGLVIRKISQDYNPEALERLELLRWLESCGVRVFSAPAGMLRLINRLSCTVALRGAGIPMPATTVTEDLEHAKSQIRNYGAAVLKPLYSTKARGMQLLSGSDPQLHQKVLAFREAGNSVMYIQQKLDSIDRDYALAFLGGEYLGCYARVKAEHGWSTTTHDGGRYAPFTPSGDLIDLAERAQRPFALDFTSVDVVETSEGPLVFEVSAFGGFRGLLEGAKLDAAHIYSAYVLERMRS